MCSTLSLQGGPLGRAVDPQARKALEVLVRGLLVPNQLHPAF
jgi:hypothetical protein